MASITISAGRIALVDATIRKFVASFLKPIESMDDFVSVFHPDIEWYDHPFLMHRIGHNAIEGLHKSFTYCNQPFDVQIKVSALYSSGRNWVSTLERMRINHDSSARPSSQQPQVQSWNNSG